MWKRWKLRNVREINKILKDKGTKLHNNLKQIIRDALNKITLSTSYNSSPMSRRWLKGTQFLIIPHTRTHLYFSMYLTAAQRLINFVCSVCHVRWARGCPRQHICSKYLKNRWRYHGKLKKEECNAPRSQTHRHVPPFLYTVHTSTYIPNAGCYVIICITISAYDLRELSVHCTST